MPLWYWVIGAWLSLPLLFFIFWPLTGISRTSLGFRGINIINKNYLAEFLTNDSSIKKLPFLIITKWKVKRYNYGPRGFYYDATAAFVLETIRGPLACIAFEGYAENLRVYVLQIQGRGGTNAIPSGFRWEKFLLAHVVGWARKNGFKEILVQPARLNKWCPGEPYSEQGKQEYDRLKLRYDVTAKRMGFKFNKETGYYIKSLV